MSSRELETLDLRHVGEVAAVIARQADHLLESPQCLSNSALKTYWDASRKRADLWQYALDDALEASRRDQPLGKHAVRSATTVIGEVLATELVTRLWTAVIVGHERRHQTQHEVLARRVLSDHLTARRSCLRLLTHPIALPSSQIVTLDRIRQRAERWTDCLLATLPDDCSPIEFAFDLSRFQEFAEDSDVVTRLSSRLSGWHLLALSLRVSSSEGPAADQTRNALHREILDAIGSVIAASESASDEAVETDTVDVEALDDKAIEPTKDDHGFESIDFPMGDSDASLAELEPVEETDASSAVTEAEAVLDAHFAPSSDDDADATETGANQVDVNRLPPEPSLIDRLSIDPDSEHSNESSNSLPAVPLIDGRLAFRKLRSSSR